MDNLKHFIDDWTVDTLGIKPIFVSLMEDITARDDVEVRFKARPGISYSLRGIPKNQIARPLFVMIDIIDDDPGARWLSVCFYGDTIHDPEERGDLIPEGLLGEDGYCFDITAADNECEAYVGERLREAYASTRFNH